MGFVTASTAMARKMGYKTPKFCKIVDWRLTITNLALQVVITFYVLYALIRGKTYLQTEVPIGKVTNWGNGNTVFSKVQEQSKTQITTAVETVTASTTVAGETVTETVETTILGCATSSELDGYKFDYDDTWKYTDVACAYLTPDELITKETTGGMFITTHITETITEREPTSSACSGTSGQLTKRYDNPVNGICYYDSVKDWLAIGAEHTSIGISHEYDTLTAGKSGANPKTYVRRAGSSENLHVFEAGKSISLKLKEILDVAQVDLDKRYEDQTPLAGQDVSSLYGLKNTADAARTPMARLAGVRLKAQIRYYNYNLEDVDSQETGSDEPYAILEIEPSFTWTSKGQKISYRTPSTSTNADDPINGSGETKGVLLNMYAYGVHIDITTSGMIGSINYVYLINVLVSGLVMLKLAGTICDLIAMYGLGTRSLIYSNHMLEEANFVKESAKYAVQGMMAVTSFQAADSSGSGNLDIDELYEWLVTAFHADDGMSINEKGGVDKSMRHRLTLRECREMARYIMAAGDREAQERFAKGLPPMSYEELKAARIDLEEWIELCTEGPMDIPTLKKVIAMDNEEQEAQRKLREMFGE